MWRRATVMLAGAVLAGAPANVWASGLEVRVGGFFPQADSNRFSENAELFDVGKKDYRGPTAGIEFSVRLVPNLELGAHVDGYFREKDTEYRDWQRQEGTSIRQTLRLSIVPVGLTLRLVPTSRHARLAPYLAAGVDLFFWRYEAEGDFIDFQDPELPILYDRFISDGVTPGFHVAAGIRIPFNEDFSLVAEGRYQRAKVDDMKGDFSRPPGEAAHQLDLSGASATLGIHLRF